jgi:predicted transposase YdaD
MALYPLCRHGEQPKESILHAATKIENNEADAAIRGDLLTSLGIFGRLAYPGLDALSLIGREKMKESKAYQEILDEGETIGRRNSLLEVVESRFGKRQTASLKTALKSVDDANRLRALIKLASRCEKIDELIAAASK